MALADLDALIQAEGGGGVPVPLADLKRRIRGIGASQAEARKTAGRAFYAAVCDLDGYAIAKIERRAAMALEAGEDPDTVAENKDRWMRRRLKADAHRCALADKEMAMHAADGRAVMALTELCEEVGGDRPVPSASTPETIAALESAILARGR